ncbi:MAG: APC family permease, partial [Kiritimatiellaeota bacterium]|nr:APC family permease [Kiritimatiellota bacterium]
MNLLRGYERLKMVLLGRNRNPLDQRVYHQLSLVAFLAWVGLGADGLSSVCYGPEEAFKALGQHGYLGVFVGLATALTVVIIGLSYSQIVEVFPSGGGGYVVSTKLLNPTLGVISGCALLIDYVLTIAVSIASGADALYSFLPVSWLHTRFIAIMFCVGLLTLLNLRGVRESVQPMVPIFLVFVLTHIFAIGWAFFADASHVGALVQQATTQASALHGQVGLLGMLALLVRAYGMGAGTYTGIEAVSNALPILREPRVHTARVTMRYMMVSLAFMALGLLTAYWLCDVHPVEGKTLNAVLIERLTSNWNGSVAKTFLYVTLVSEAAILFIAAQTGFLGGPRVLASMALDRWVPSFFATLSDHLVTRNGVLLMSGAALLVLWATGGSVTMLVVLYSINVFITFVLSQAGMIRHWWQERTREPRWRRKLFINGLGGLVALGILISMTVTKFNEGGWVTLLITGLFVGVAHLIRRYYNATFQHLKRLDNLVEVANDALAHTPATPPTCAPDAKTAVILVGGFNGMGLHTTFDVIRLFGECYRSFAFVQVGVIDVGSFKGQEAIRHLQEHVPREL